MAARTHRQKEVRRHLILYGALGRGAAIALFLFPLLLPLMILMLRNLKRREY